MRIVQTAAGEFFVREDVLVFVRRTRVLMRAEDAYQALIGRRNSYAEQIAAVRAITDAKAKVREVLAAAPE